MARAFYVGGIVALSTALGWAVFVGRWLEPRALQEEIIKVGVQVLVFGVAGGGIKVLLDQAEARRAFRADMLARLGRAHREVYRVRRLLPVVDDRERLQLLGQLMDARQDLGSTYHEVRGSRLRERRRIEAEVECMRRYMEEVIDGAFAPADHPQRTVYDEFLNVKLPESRYEREYKQSFLRAKALAAPKGVER